MRVSPGLQGGGVHIGVAVVVVVGVIVTGHGIWIFKPVYQLFPSLDSLTALDESTCARI